jgi:hypothetical protein
MGMFLKAETHLNLVFIIISFKSSINILWLGVDMKKLLIIPIVIMISGASIGLGTYFWLNPIGGSDQGVVQSPPKDLPVGTVLLNGTFIEFDSAHYGRGVVQIVEFPDGKRRVQFVEVELAPGPDLYVYFSDKSTFSGIRDGPGNFTNLGLLPYTSGNFSMGTKGVNLANVRSVLIWCKQFSVAFTYATLT